MLHIFITTLLSDFSYLLGLQWYFIVFTFHFSDYYQNKSLFKCFGGYLGFVFWELSIILVPHFSSHLSFRWFVSVLHIFRISIICQWKVLPILCNFSSSFLFIAFSLKSKIHSMGNTDMGNMVLISSLVLFLKVFHLLLMFWQLCHFPSSSCLSRCLCLVYP